MVSFLAENHLIRNGLLHGRPITLNSTLRLSRESVGTVVGNFIHPGLNLKKTCYGVVLQQQNTARGYFLGSAETGLFRLRAD